MVKRRDLSALRRRKPFRAPRRTLIIVCEGAKTEPNYFDFYKRKLGLANVSVKVFGEECGSDPASVVQFALGEMEKDSGIDECHCVVDRDEHSNVSLGKAKQLIASKADPDDARIYRLYVSDPCIEYWFILHFTYTRAPIVREGTRSRGDCAKALLVQHWPEYTKNAKGTGEFLDQRLGDALTNAERAFEDAERTGEPNPSSNLHQLLRHLSILRS